MSLLTNTQGLFKYQSGRVIALGRVMLALMFLMAVWADKSEPVREAAPTLAVLIVYAVGAVGIAAATWRNWWLDARLAMPMHAFDMAVFTAIVFSTNGSTSPFFLFFILPLLSAAIRWGWRETALTAAALVGLYFGAGLLLASKQGWHLERFVVRSGHLIILSLLLIWFGIHQHISRLFFQVEDLDEGRDQNANPLARALSLTMAATGATNGALLIAPAGDEASEGLMIHGGKGRSITFAGPIVRNTDAPAFMFDIARSRVLTRGRHASFSFAQASAILSIDDAVSIGLGEGLAAQVTGTQQGWLLLWGIPDISCDFIDLGRELGRATGAIIDRHALFQAIELSAAARTRLGLARDVHDSIVQFLAGAAFRVEAIKRAAAAGGKVGNELDELKRLLVEEQGEIRGFLLALRRDRELELAEAVAELRLLAERLSQQWSVDCHITAQDSASSIPIRLQLDLQQMLREAVANAVRHGGADRVDVGLAIEKGHLQLTVVDNGTGFAQAAGNRLIEPQSLKERVERAHGSLHLMTSPGATNIVISVPLAGVAA